MQYAEVVERIRKHKGVKASDITGMQMIMLLQDREIKTVIMHGNEYEIYFIPVTYAFEAIELSDVNCPTLYNAERFLEEWIERFENNKDIFVQIEDEFFQIIIDVLETVE